MKLRCEFEYYFVNDVLCIVDLDDGKCSVTNDADAVVAWAFEQVRQHKMPVFNSIVYRDSRGIWDRMKFFNAEFSEFESINETDIDLALMKLSRRYPLLVSRIMSEPV